MNYQEMQQAEAALKAATEPTRKPRGATKEQLEYRAKFLRPQPLAALINDGSFAARSGR